MWSTAVTCGPIKAGNQEFPLDQKQKLINIYAMMKFIFALLIAQITCQAAFADVEKTSYVSVMAGLLKNTSRSEDYSEYVYSSRAGLDVAKGHDSTIAVGLVLARSPSNLTVGNLTAKSRFSLIGAEILSRKIWGSGLYYGLRAGIGLTHAELTAGSTKYMGNGSSFVWGVVVGYEIPASTNILATVDLSYVSVGSSTIDAVDYRIPVEADSYLLMQVGVLFDF